MTLGFSRCATLPVQAFPYRRECEYSVWQRYPAQSMSLGPRTRVRQMPSLPHPTRIRNFILLAVLLVLFLWAISTAADLIISYNWWKEVGQVGTWISMLWYSIAPTGAGTVIAFVA